MTRAQSLKQLLLRLSLWPTLADEERTQRARTFHGVAWSTLLMLVALHWVLIAMQPETLSRRLGSMAMYVAPSLIGLWFNWLGKLRLASWFLVLAITVTVTVRGYSSGGITAPLLSMFVYTCLVAGTLLGTRSGALTGLGLGAIGFWFAWLQTNGKLMSAAMTFTPYTTWVFLCMGLGLSVLLQPQITRALSESLARAKTEIAARNHAEQRLRVALDAGNIGVWDYSVETGLLTADQRLLDLYGLPAGPDQTFSRDAWLARVHPEDRPLVSGSFEGLLSGRVAIAERQFRAVPPSGEPRYIFSAARAMKDEAGKIVGIVGVNRDITPNKLAEAERQRLTHVLGERVKELSLLHEAARLLRHDRPADRALFQELVDKIPGAFQFPERCAARIVYQHVEVVTPGFAESSCCLSKRFSINEGGGSIDVIYAEPSSPGGEVAFLPEEGTLLGSLADMLVGYLELRQYHEQLEELVATRTRQMQQAKEEAEQASKAKGAFLAAMSHEIRTPMNAILGYAQLMRRDRELSPEQQRQVDTILASGEHLLTVINDVLEMSKIEAGRTVLAPEVVDLPGMLEGIRQMFVPLTRNKGLNLSFEVSSALPRFVEADPGKLRQVVINLLGNAVKFTPRGSVSLRATPKGKTERGHLLEVVVEDTGPGIEAEDLERVFGTFEQTSVGARAGGTGLGLPIGRHLARLMGGDLKASSRPGHGSSFVFTFEVADAASEARPGWVGSYPATLKPGQRACKLLVVDDVAENVTLATSLFRSAGFEVKGASSAEAGIELHDSWQPDLILMDLRMPGMGGLEAIRQLRASGSGAALVAFTASGFEELTDAARALGANEVVLKPYRETELLETVAGLLDLELSYQAPSTSESRSPRRPAASLASLLHGVPAPLRQQLREAVLQARAQRVESLAAEVSAFSAEAADQVRELARDFRYGDIATALADA